MTPTKRLTNLRPVAQFREEPDGFELALRDEDFALLQRDLVLHLGFLLLLLLIGTFYPALLFALHAALLALPAALLLFALLFCCLRLLLDPVRVRQKQTQQSVSTSSPD